MIHYATAAARSLRAKPFTAHRELNALWSNLVSGMAAMGERRFFLIATAVTLLVAGVAILIAFIIIEHWRGGVP